MQEHKLILRALDILDAMSASAEKDGTLNESDVEKILDFLRWFADAHHQAKEETILFPALKRVAASQQPSLEHMAFEHKQERGFIEDIETSLRLAKLPEFVTRSARLGSILRNHIYKEDHILFEAADAVFTPEEDEAVAGQLSRFDTSLDKQILDERLKDLRSLEWKYLGK
jgi:hemerythrin-like domain-containing protein